MSDLITAMGSIYTFVISQFSQVFTTITGNAILYLPVLLALFSAILFYVLKIVKKLGVRGRRG